MSRLDIILGIIMFVSLAFNVFLVVYLRGVIIRLLSISEELGDFQQMVNVFVVTRPRPIWVGGWPAGRKIVEIGEDFRILTVPKYTRRQQI